MRRIELFAYGQPAPQGSKKYVGLRAGRAILIESSKGVGPWRAAVEAAARVAIAAQGTEWAPMNGPLSVRMVFTLRKPLSAPKRTRTFPMKYPDLSKIVRSTEDALTVAGLWVDDSRVTEYARLAKVFPGEDPESLDRPGVLIIVTEQGSATEWGATT